MILLAALAAASGAARAADPAPIPVPSGAVVTWLDTIQNAPGPAGLTYRYRFIMPDLAKLVPATEGPAGEMLTPEDQAELDRLGTDAAPPAADGAMMDMAPTDGAPTEDTAAGALADAELVSPEDLDLPDFRPEDFAPEGEAAADAALASGGAAGTGGPAPAGNALAGAVALPPEPDLLLQDPVHEDIVWLCENWVLPRLAAPAPLPGQVIISLADRPSTFGAMDASVVQLFEAFSITPDRTQCRWEAW